MSVHASAKEQINKKNDVKARSLLLIALLNEHQLTFSQYNDAKTMFAAIETRFRGNEATKKTQKILLKQRSNGFEVATLSPKYEGKRMGHFSRECKAQRTQDGWFRNQDNTRKQGKNKDTSSKAMLAIDGVGLDWSDMAEEHVHTNMPLMAFSDSKANTARPRVVYTARPYIAPINTVRAKRINAIKGSTSWVWRPTRPNGASLVFTRHNYIDARGNITYLSDFKEFDGGYVTFRGEAHGGRFSSKGTLKTDSLDFKNVYFVNELKFNLFSVSQMYDKKNYVLYTSTECLVLSPNFKLPDESQLLLKIPKKDNMYSYDMKNIIPKERLTCLIVKATLDESLLWHKRLSYINFKNINRLVQDNLVRGLPIKHFENDQTCVACFKGKQHRASFNSKVLNPTTKPLFMLHMDLFGLTFMSSLMHKKYCLVITDDYSRFTWVFFLTTKDETSEILKNFIKEIENLMDKKVKITRCDNGTEFKNKVMDNFCTEKGKFDGKSDEGFFVRYSLSSKAFRVYNIRTRKVKENLHIRSLENKPMIEGNGLKWLFDINSLTQSMNYVRVAAGTIFDEYVDASYFDTPSKDVKDGTHNENYEKDKSKDDSSPKEVNAVRKHVNTASLEVTTGHFKFNTIDPSLNTASSSDPHSPTDMFKLGASDTLEATHVEFFSDRDAPDVDLGNIPNSYGVLTTSHTRIHKDHPIEKVIGEVRSFVQTRRMIQPTSGKGIKDPDHPDKVYKVVKALYGLHQAPRAWYDTLANYLLSNGFQKGKIDPTLFLKKQKGDIFLVQIYVDGLQVTQKEDGIFVSQDKYVHEILKKFNYSDVKSASTSVDLEKSLVKDGDANDVDVHLYRSMIRSLIYLIASRPDIMFAVMDINKGTKSKQNQTKPSTKQKA
uniref:Putative ribonuclease H-like domain-containing protein n=1 Tax=Tanacetum cinerariifolium TaxID=118510 RepID=A0A6L2JFE2_TANCI|nr:putative ribonuclease H-like domain-containing protein [Tanacetum cinerariifolium]